jgi:hypothetical protein
VLDFPPKETTYTKTTNQGSLVLYAEWRTATEKEPMAEGAPTRC